jgi:hypothetical protein
LKSDESLACSFVIPLILSHNQPEGKSVIEFNAGFNTKTTATRDLSRISGAKLYRIDIESKPALREKYKIKSLPTIIYFNDGQERYRWEAGIDMRLHVHFTEINEVLTRY